MKLCKGGNIQMAPGEGQVCRRDRAVSWWGGNLKFRLGAHGKVGKGDKETEAEMSQISWSMSHCRKWKSQVCTLHSELLTTVCERLAA